MKSASKTIYLGELNNTPLGDLRLAASDVGLVLGVLSILLAFLRVARHAVVVLRLRRKTGRMSAMGIRTLG